MKISDLMVPDNMMLDLAVTSKAALFEQMTHVLKQNGFLKNEQKFLKDLYKREAEFSTGIGDGVAIPHAKSKYVKKATIAVAKLSSVLTDYETLDNQPVKWVFMLAIPVKDSDQHLTILSYLARKMMHDSFKRQIESVTDRTALLQIMEKEEVT